MTLSGTLFGVPSDAVIAAAHAPKVSIATCTYNRPDFLREAVESLRAQTDPDWEHLIFDNGSTDPRVRDVLAWAREDPRVRVFRGRENQDRPARFWNYLLDRARGRYLGTLDDDNTKLPDFVRVMAGELDRDPALGLVTCGFVVRARGQRDWEHHHNLDTSPETTAERSTCEGGATLYRREAFERVGYFSEAIRTNEDWDWIRRAVRTVKFNNLPACLTTYRQHDANRQLRADSLGHNADVEALQRREIRPTLGVRLVRPWERLTRSQVDVVESVERALRVIPWVEPGEDLVILIAPFQMTDAEIRVAVRSARRVLFLHMEDPYALGVNLDHVRMLQSVCKEIEEVRVATNDLATVPYYRDVVGDRVIVWPSLGADDQQVGLPVDIPERDVDVLFCGYAYLSRVRFMDALLPRLRGRGVLLCGDGWEKYPAWLSSPTQALLKTYALHARARAVVCAHRVRGDCADGPVEPRTVNRGFMEGFSGARVFMDRTRSAHPFQDGDVVFYDSPEDLAEKINRYLDGEPDPRAVRFQDTCRLLYTYRVRVARILNCVRAPRFGAEIP